MAIYTQNQLDRLADKVCAGEALSNEEAINLIRDCGTLRVDLIDARESVAELEAKLADAAELEQWRRAIVWGKDSIDGTWSLRIVRTGTTLSYVMPADGDWLVGRGGQRYPSRDAAMRAAEAPFGLPKCRVEGEP